VRVQGLALAGVLVLPGEEPAEVRAQWAGLPPDVEVVLLTRRAADSLERVRRTGLTVVMPP
jgi:hypothetical protein